MARDCEYEKNHQPTINHTDSIRSFTAPYNAFGGYDLFTHMKKKYDIKLVSNISSISDVPKPIFPLILPYNGYLEPGKHHHLEVQCELPSGNLLHSY